MLEFIAAFVMFFVAGVLMSKLPLWKMILVIILLIGGSAVLRASEVYQSLL